jgi:replicative DNA helicase
MSKLLKQARHYTTLGLSVILLAEDKTPALSSWTDLQRNRLTEEELLDLFEGKAIRPEILDKEGKPKGMKAYKDILGIGILGGSWSGTDLPGLEIIDVDSKYDTTGTLWEDLRAMIIRQLGQDFFDSVVIARTPSGGYHIYYRATNIESNQKLAKRPATPQEIQQGEKGDRAILETRGTGGYVGAYPTPGYEFIQGSADTIPVITPADRNELKNICKGFDLSGFYDKSYKDKKKKPTGSALPGVSTIEDYQNKADIIELLEKHDFSVVGETKDLVYIKRKGSSASSSGNYHKDMRLLKFFSTNVDGFEPERAYNIFEVYYILEHNGESGKAFYKLFEEGYGSEDWRMAWLEKQKEQEPPHPADVFDSQTILIETTDKRTGEVTSVLAPGGSVKAKDLERLSEDTVILQVYSNTTPQEAVQAIRTAVKSGKRVLVCVDGEEPVYWFKYELGLRVAQYEQYIAESEGLSDLQIEDLRKEIGDLGLRIPDPMDRDHYKKIVTSEVFAEIGITEESLEITLDQLRADEDREKQKKKMDLLLGKVTTLQDEGKTQEALELISKETSDIKLIDKAGEFDKLLRPTSEEEIKKEEASLPDSLNTGFIIAGEELLLPGGQISIYAGPTNHGKTIVLINTALQVADRYPDKKFIFFSYEERANSIIQYFLNTYINLDFNSSKGGNRRLLRDYFRTGSTQFIAQANRDHFESKKAEFFRDYIENGRILIKGVDYNSDELDLAIRHLHKKEPSLGGVFIDYFQLLRLPQAQSKNSRQEELKQICLDLNSLAKNTGLPLILSAQFNREVTNLRRLHPTSIGEAGDIERIVNTLIGLWNMDKKPVLKGITDAEADEINDRIRKRLSQQDGARNMYLEILKSRDLPTGAYDFLEFNGNTGKVSNRAEKIKGKDPF